MRKAVQPTVVIKKRFLFCLIFLGIFLGFFSMSRVKYYPRCTYVVCPRLKDADVSKSGKIYKWIISMQCIAKQQNNPAGPAKLILRQGVHLSLAPSLLVHHTGKGKRAGFTSQLILECAAQAD